MGIGLVSGIGRFLIAQLKTDVPNAQEREEFRDSLHLFEQFPANK
jgi:hypothetical protein